MTVLGTHHHPYAFKWNSKAKTRIPHSFQNAYPGSLFQVVDPGQDHTQQG